MRGEEVVLEGLGVSCGIGIGAPLFLALAEEVCSDEPLSEHAVEEEVLRYRVALDRSRADVEHLQRVSLLEGPDEMSAILGAHLEMLKDPYLTTGVEERIRAYSRSTESVFRGIVEDYKRRFRNLADGHFEERVRDIVDVSRRVMDHLRAVDRLSLAQLEESTIVLAHDLLPTDTVEADASQIRGFITSAGGHTSHAAIIARAKGIPYVAHVDIKGLLRDGLVQQVIVDGTRGQVIVNPSHETLKKYEAREKGDRDELIRLQEKARHPVRSKAHVLANLESPREIADLIEFGAEGIGLFRSEYLALKQGRFPTEEEQVEAYSELVRELQGRPLTLRLFDVGGDKQVAHVTPERNPALGCRAIRFLMRFPEILKTQIRAIERAASGGPIQILLPMVTDIEELRFVRKEVSPGIKVGCMIEVPASAVLSDIWAREADFLSIGTNDLVQYTLAADRSNPYTASFYKPYHLSLLRLIRGIVVACDEAQKPLVLCGESAADPKLIPLFWGLGVRRFSVAVRHIPALKGALDQLSQVGALELARKALACSTASELEALL